MVHQGPACNLKSSTPGIGASGSSRSAAMVRCQSRANGRRTNVRRPLLGAAVIVQRQVIEGAHGAAAEPNRGRLPAMGNPLLREAGAAASGRGRWSPPRAARSPAARRPRIEQRADRGVDLAAMPSRDPPSPPRPRAGGSTEPGWHRRAAIPASAAPGLDLPRHHPEEPPAGPRPRQRFAAPRPRPPPSRHHRAAASRPAPPRPVLHHAKGHADLRRAWPRPSASRNGLRADALAQCLLLCVFDLQRHAASSFSPSCLQLP